MKTLKMKLIDVIGIRALYAVLIVNNGKNKGLEFILLATCAVLIAHHLAKSTPLPTPRSGGSNAGRRYKRPRPEAAGN